MTEYRGYAIEHRSRMDASGRWRVIALVRRAGAPAAGGRIFEDPITYILEIEAKREAVNLAKRLIDRNLVGF